MAEEIVLVVDDDRTTVRLCQRLLERASYQVITAMHPLEALALLREKQVDLLLSDIRMPVMDGFELIRQAKEIQPELSVLVMTGYGSIDNAIQALHRGVDGLILKPFPNPADLVQSVQRVIAENQQKKNVAKMQVLRPLFDVSERLLAETTSQTLESLIITTISDLFHTAYAGIYILSGEHNSLSAVRTSDERIEPDKNRQIETLIQIILQEGSPVQVCACEPCSNNSAQQLMRQMDISALMLAHVQRTSAFIFLAARGPGQTCFTQADLEMFVIFARQAAVALENAKLYSELKEYIHQVEESQRALVQVEKMAVVGRLVASMAHEINNPLQAVRNCLHLANRKGLASEQRFRYLEMMDIELERLVLTVKQMLDFYRPGSADREMVEITQVVTQVIELLKPQFKDKHIQVHFQPDTGKSLIHVIPGQIQQVIFNLLINSMDAIEASDSSSQGAERRDIWIDTYFSDPKVFLRVEDSGQGVSKDLKEQVFEPFVSTKQNGTGLGLAVSYGIMERHQGSLELAAPKHGNGACFEISLPSGIERKNGKSIDR